VASRERQVHLSKYLSLHLRHRPEALGLTLGPGGWVEIDALLQAAAARGFQIGRDELKAIVASNYKQRFSISPDGKQIRANQGHSVSVDLELAPALPPPLLYHGTGEQSVRAIQAEGLRQMRRHHVHLSADAETARRVGARHGRPAIFTVDAARMSADGHAFYRSENGVWLVETVPAAYLTLIR
jgi:putative RNA 2'-phosphotransferase